MLRLGLTIMTGLMLLAAALWPTASAQAATASVNGYAAQQQWQTMIEKLIQRWNQPTVKVTVVTYTTKTEKPRLVIPAQPQTPKTPEPVTTTPTTKPQPPTTPNNNGDTRPTAPAPAGLTADEQRMVELVNQERQKAGLAPLAVDMDLVKVARIKAQDMIQNGYFSHTSPTYGSPFDMMRSFGITNWRAAAENIAQNPSVDGAHNSFMNSTGHRNNILNPAFNKVGIGIVDGGPYGKTFVQLFIQSY